MSQSQSNMNGNETYITEGALAYATPCKEGSARNKCLAAAYGDRVIGVNLKKVTATGVETAVATAGTQAMQLSGTCAINDLLIPAGADKVKKRLVLTGVTAADAGDLFTKAAHGLSTGDQVILSAEEGGAVPTPLLHETVYYVIKVDANTFHLADTLAHANAATALVIGADSTGLIIKQSLRQGSLVGRAKAAGLDGDFVEVELHPGVLM